MDTVDCSAATPRYVIKLNKNLSAGRWRLRRPSPKDKSYSPRLALGRGPVVKGPRREKMKKRKKKLNYQHNALMRSLGRLRRYQSARRPRLISGPARTSACGIIQNTLEMRLTGPYARSFPEFVRLPAITLHAFPPAAAGRRSKFPVKVSFGNVPPSIR
ncbi:hypothetical protein EVAR_40883_1 [Eumeta japonica]|uniref:Uncharacterized protein n=1 Tax=Eumeta variegata TaxID=151549 RepID=A0A4C1X8B7_EUMVA|nr:hypothetical protein EVAR_40883_1 [Eumeta japonica]